MKRVLYISIIAVMVFCKLDAQFSIPQKIYLQGGFSFPYAPQQFFDYWKDGYGVEVSGIYDYEKPFDYTFSIGYSFFQIDRGRILKKLKLGDESIAIQGAESHIINMYWMGRYLVPGYETIMIYGLLGGGFSYSMTASSSVDYVYHSVKKDASSHGTLIFPIGFSIEKEIKGNNWIFEFKQFISPTKAQTINTDYTAVRVGLAFSLQ